MKKEDQSQRMCNHVQVLILFYNILYLELVPTNKISYTIKRYFIKANLLIDIVSYDILYPFYNKFDNLTYHFN